MSHASCASRNILSTRRIVLFKSRRYLRRCAVSRILFSAAVVIIAATFHTCEVVAANTGKPKSRSAIPSFFWGEWSENGLEECEAKTDSNRIILGARRFFIQGNEVPVGYVKVRSQHSFTVFGTKANTTFAQFDHDPKQGITFRDSEIFLTRCPKKTPQAKQTKAD